MAPELRNRNSQGKAVSFFGNRLWLNADCGKLIASIPRDVSDLAVLRAAVSFSDEKFVSGVMAAC